MTIKIKYYCVNVAMENIIPTAYNHPYNLYQSMIGTVVRLFNNLFASLILFVPASSLIT